MLFYVLFLVDKIALVSGSASLMFFFFFYSSLYEVWKIYNVYSINQKK